MHHPLRQKGKIQELSLGFGGWIGALKAFGAEGTDRELQDQVLAWRAASPAVVEFWGGQTRDFGRDGGCLFGLEGAVIQALTTPDQFFPVMRLDGTYSGISYVFKDDALYCQLPSGRYLTYHRPRLRETGNWRGYEISYEGYNTNPKSGPIGWIRMTIYSGKFCIAEGTLVLTLDGWVKIEDITPLTKVWDGVEWVSCDGRVCNGERETIDAHGVRMTPDHLVLTVEGWKDASSSGGFDRADARIPDGVALPTQRRRSQVGLAAAMPVWRDEGNGSLGISQAAEAGDSGLVWVPKIEDDIRVENIARPKQAPSLRGMAVDESTMHSAKPSGLAKLWRAGDYRLRRMARQLRGLLGGHGAIVSSGLGNRTNRQQRPVLRDQLHLDHPQEAGQQPTHERHPQRQNGCADSRGNRPAEIDGLLQTEKVYDLINCGPRHRFTVWGESGPLIVHNCENVVQAVARDVQRNAINNLERRGYSVVLHVYDEDVAEIPQGWGSIEEFESIMNDLPTWAKGWPISASGGWRGARYRKA